VIEDVRNWLPDTAFTDEAVKAALADTIGKWSGAWFSGRTAALSRIRAVQARTLVAADTLQIHGVLAAIDAPDSGKRYLLEAALDMRLSGQALQESDRNVLDLFASKILEDLIGRLDKAFGGMTSDGARLGFTLSLSGHDMLSASLPQHVLVPAIKAQHGGARRTRVAPRSRHKALGPTEVTVTGLLGRAELAVDDLKGLAEGDVLILDRALHEVIDLRLKSGNRPVGRGRLGRNDGRVSIQF